MVLLSFLALALPGGPAARFLGPDAALERRTKSAKTGKELGYFGPNPCATQAKKGCNKLPSGTACHEYYAEGKDGVKYVCRKMHFSNGCENYVWGTGFFVPLKLKCEDVRNKPPTPLAPLPKPRRHAAVRSKSTRPTSNSNCIRRGSCRWAS